MRLIGLKNKNMKSPTSKLILALLAIFIVGMFIYNSLLSSGDVMPLDLTSSTIGNDLLELRNELQQVTLERELFSDNKFLELADFSTVIPTQPTGRTNPFNAIGRD